MAASLTGLCQRKRGTGLVNLTLNVADDLTSLEPSMDCYARDRNAGQAMPKDGLSALVIGINMEDDMHIATIGPRLASLSHWPRVGPSVMKILNHGLNRCTNSMNPHNAVDWASRMYWQGEKDESNYLDEHLAEAHSHAAAQIKSGSLKKMPTEAELIEDLGIFTRANFDASIPREFSDTHALKHLPEKLDVCGITNLSARFASEAGVAHGLPAELTETQAAWPAIRAACVAIQAAARRDTTHDPFDQSAWECIPFVLRWAEDDCMTRILDDTINQLIECGDCNLSANTVFLFHDARTLASTLARFTNWLRLLRACEDLIRLLTTHIHSQRQP